MKQVCAEHLLSVGSVEAFNERVLGGFAGLNVCELHLMLFGPVDELVGDEFWAVVQAYLFGKSTPFGRACRTIQIWEIL